MNDLISVVIFNQFASIKKIKSDNKIIEDYYNRIINNFKKNNNIEYQQTKIDRFIG